jgi:hypothetical protein
LQLLLAGRVAARVCLSLTLCVCTCLPCTWPSGTCAHAVLWRVLRLVVPCPPSAVNSAAGPSVIARQLLPQVVNEPPLLSITRTPLRRLVLQGVLTAARESAPPRAGCGGQCFSSQRHRMEVKASGVVNCGGVQ